MSWENNEDGLASCSLRSADLLFPMVSIYALNSRAILSERLRE